MISRSDQRNTFQLEKYIERCKEKGEEPSQEYLDMYKNIFDTHKHKFDDPKERINDMEYDLLTTVWILEKVRKSESYAQNLYAAMCNTEFVKNDVWPKLKDERWGCSWRYAGGIIADMLQKGDYVDWYCSGIGSNKNGYVGEGYVTDEIREDLLKLGWVVIDDEQRLD